MAEGISAVLTYAVGVAISPVPIIGVILMLFSARARVNGPVFLAGWALALAVVSGVVYFISDESNAATDSNASDGVSWAHIIFGVLFLLLAARFDRLPLIRRQLLLGQPRPALVPEEIGASSAIHTPGR